MELAFAAAALWFAWGVLRALRDVLAERAADWLLPPQQPITFRFAQFLALLAKALAPRRNPVWNPDPEEWRHSWYMIFPVRWSRFYWPEPESMLAELESDRRAERQVLDPVRLVAPLLVEAMTLRLNYLRRTMIHVAWIPVGLILYPLVMLILWFGLEDGIFYVVGQARRAARRVRFGAHR